MNKQPNTGENVLQTVPFLAISDMEASIKFYIDKIGFEITQTWIDEGKLRWCWLRRGGAALMLQEFRTEGHDAWVPQGKVGEGVTIFFICLDALAIYREITTLDVKASTPFVGNGMWTTGMSDPDGYQLNFESSTDVPEGTVYEDNLKG